MSQACGPNLNSASVHRTAPCAEYETATDSNTNHPPVAMSRSKARNPYFHDAHHVWLPYAPARRRRYCLTACALSDWAVGVPPDRIR